MSLWLERLGKLIRLEHLLSPELEGVSLEGTFHQAYFKNLFARIENKSYPRLSPEVIKQISVLTAQKTFIPTQATRTLRVDFSYEEFMERAGVIIAKYSGRIPKKEVERLSATIFKEISFGQMFPLLVGNLGGPFKNTRVATDPALVIEPGTFGVIVDLDPDFHPPRLHVYWEGFGPQSPGRTAWIPTVSLQPGSLYDLKIFLDKKPEELGITVHHLLHQDR